MAGSSTRKAPGNHLLSSLSTADFALLKRHLSPVELGLRRPLEDANKPIRHVYFPETAIVSVVAEGTPRELMESVGADVFEIEGADGSAAPRLLRELPWVHGVTQLGVRLRVLADRGVSEPAGKLGADLRKHGIDARIQRTHASLEDVFVVSTRKDKHGQQ